ncbi:MAG: polysaccharide biosynthesis C-terminal domain-containing protein [Spirochaetaceae bacterium]|jgi:putative MATE family efflux protein|nr:polysaccharide biosynthesis C-terminal domain-containing protein [Spirochaetaceae bacterium]
MLSKIRLGPPAFYREALSIALPVMLQQLIMSMVSLIDNFMVAGLGDISMAAVNVANQINFIHIVILNTICGAGGIYIAQFRGAADNEGMKHAFRFKIIFGLCASVLYFILCWTIPRQMIAVMTMRNAAQEELIAAGSAYLRITSFTLFPMAVSFAAGSSFREIGVPKIPLFVSTAATLVNTVGNWILIYGNLGAPRFEVNGAAMATVLARYTEMAVFLIYLRKRPAPFFTGLRKLFIVNRRLVTEILSKSGMMFFSELSWISSETIMTALYNGRGGAEVVAGMAAGFTIANIFFLIFGGIWTTTTVLVGGSLGAGKLEEARKRAGWIKSGSLAIGIIIAVLGAAAALLLIPLVFSNLSSQARNISLGLVFTILLYLPLWGLLNAMFAISRAGGDTAMGMYTDLSVNTLLFVPGCFILALGTSMGPVTMYALLKLTDIIKLFVARHFLNKERWVRNLTVRNPPEGGPGHRPKIRSR